MRPFPHDTRTRRALCALAIAAAVLGATTRPEHVGGARDTAPPGLFLTLEHIPDDQNDLLVVPPGGFRITLDFDPGDGAAVDPSSLVAPPDGSMLPTWGPPTDTVWATGRSWLLDLTTTALVQDPDLSGFAGRVSDSGEGRWTIKAAIDEAVPAPVLTTALYQRFSSRGEADFADKILSAMRCPSLPR